MEVKARTLQLRFSDGTVRTAHLMEGYSQPVLCDGCARQLGFRDARYWVQKPGEWANHYCPGCAFGNAVLNGPEDCTEANGKLVSQGWLWELDAGGKWRLYPPPSTEHAGLSMQRLHFYRWLVLTAQLTDN